MITPEQKDLLKKSGNQLRILRTERRLSQKQLAFELGVSRAQYQNMESGKANFGILYLYKLAEVLEVEPNDLLVKTE